MEATFNKFKFEYVTFVFIQCAYVEMITLTNDIAEVTIVINNERYLARCCFSFLIRIAIKFISN